MCNVRNFLCKFFERGFKDKDFNIVVYISYNDYLDIFCLVF